MDEQDQLIALQNLKSKKVKLQQRKKELDDQLVLKKSQCKLSAHELNQKENHYKSLQNYVNLDGKLNKDQDEDSEEAEDKDKKLIEKKALEKLNFHMDKYFIYIEQYINQPNEGNQNNNNNSDSQYNAAQVLAILVKLPKSSFPNTKEIPTQMAGDDDEFVCNTFRFAKTSEFDALKTTCLRYWGFINPKQGEEQEKEEANTNSINDRFEFANEDNTIVQYVNIDQYLSNYPQEKTQFSIILRKKKVKTQKRAQNNQVDIQLKSQVKSGLGADQSDGKSDIKSIAKSDGGKSTEFQTNNPTSRGNITSVVSKNSQASGQANQDNDDDENSNDDDNPEIQNRLKIKLYQKYHQFFKRFDLIKKMFTIDPADVEERGQLLDKQQPKIKKGMECDDNNVCVIFLLTALLILNALYLYILDDGPIMYSHRSTLSTYLKIGAQGQQGSFLDISSISDLKNYLVDPTGMPQQLMTPSSNFRQNYDIVGAMRFRQVRTKYRDCPFYQRQDKKSQVQCIHDYYSHETQETGLLLDGSQPWQFFTPKYSLNFDRTVNGYFSSYDQSGYIQDLTKSNQLPKQFDKIIVENMLENDEYFTDQMLAYFLTFTVRCKNDGSLFFIELYLEYPTSGLFPAQPIIIPFSPNLFGSEDNSPYSVLAEKSMSSPQGNSLFNSGGKLYAIIILKAFFGTFYLIFTLMKLQSLLKYKLSIILKYLISITFILNVFVIYTNFQSVSDALQLTNSMYDVRTLVKLENYVDFGNVASQYQQMMKSTSSCLAMLIVRYFVLLSFFRSLEYIFQAIEQQYLQLLASFTMLITVLAGFAFVSLQVWGQYTVNFSTFGRALLSLMLMTMSCFNQDPLFNYQPTFSLIFMMFFFFFILSFMCNILAVIYIDSYRLLILNQGEIQQEKWTSSDWLQWTLSWAPDKLKRRCITGFDTEPKQD